MKPSRILFWAAFTLPVLYGQTPDVGSGPVSATITLEFQQAFFRNNFQVLVNLPPLGPVKRLGNGLVQEFASAADSTMKYALVKANTSDLVTPGVINVFQLSPQMYSYYTSVGPTAAGYPTTDTLNCPQLASSSCQYELFDLPSALFVYSSPTLNGSNFSIINPIYTEWYAQGGVGGIGPPNAPTSTATSGAGTAATATLQSFTAGAIYSITAGNYNGKVFSVREPIYDVYVTNGREAAFLGLPTGEMVTLPSGLNRQTFEGGAIQYDPTQPSVSPSLFLPVATVNISSNSTAQRLNLGDTVQLSASTYTANGALVSGRNISWVTSNGKVMTISGTGSPATATAVGGGSANITAVSEGKISATLTFFVVAPCCQVGEGSPTTAIQQLFSDAVIRTKLSVRVPTPSPVQRNGNGYTQELFPSDPNNSAHYLLAKPDSASSVYVVTGAILNAYLSAGGPTGPLGYPLSDATAGGRQTFQGGTLAGTPPVLVSGAILTRWGAQGYETGSLGSPTGAAASFLTFAPTSGTSQPFTGGAVLSHMSGTLNGNAFIVTGLILAMYSSTGGATGALGLPLDEEVALNGRRKQDFEGGLIDYAPGDASATVTLKARKPQITATPATVVPGSTIRLAVGGFPQNSTLRVTVGSQPDFLVPTQTGSYAWAAYVPLKAAAGVVTLRAADVGGTSIAVGTYSIQPSAATLYKVSKLQGDLQSGPPGARLAQPFLILVQDSAGNPVVGAAVKFSASPGSTIEMASAVTDSNGQAQASLRLPLAELPSLATAQVGQQVVTFSATSKAFTLTNFPRYSQVGLAGDPNLGNEPSKISQKGALLTASASIVRFLQNAGMLGTANGAADPSLLNQYLKSLCVFDAQGNRICDGYFSPPGAAENNVNLWRLGSFTGGNLDFSLAAPSVAAIRDVVAQGSPALIALTIGSGNAVLGSHFVAAIGVNSAGGILIQDPNPVFGRTSLDDYLNGFQSSRPYKATIAAVLQFVVRQAPAQEFLVASASGPPAIASPMGTCGYLVSWPDVASAGNEQAADSGQSSFSVCDGAQPLYQLDLTAPPGQAAGQGPLLLDLSATPGRFQFAAGLPASYQLTHPGANWVSTPLTASFDASTVVNAASFTTNLAAGGFASIFGGGLAAANQTTTVTIDGAPAPVIASTPFQVNFLIPAGTAPGQHSLSLKSPFGIHQETITVSATAPSLFTLGNNRAAALNQDNSINGVANPALRGQVAVVFGTGFGALVPQGNLQVTATPVTAMLDSRTLQVLYAGVAPGYPGLYQVNVLIPPDVPPGLNLQFSIQQGDSQSNAVLLAVQ